MTCARPRCASQASDKMRSSERSANLRASSRPRTCAACKYAETHIAFQLTYTVLSTKGVGRCRRAAYSLVFADASRSSTLDTSSPIREAISSGRARIHNTFLAEIGLSERVPFRSRRAAYSLVFADASRSSTLDTSSPIREAISSGRARIHNTFLAGSCCIRSEEHTSELQSLRHLVCRLLLVK